MSIKVNGEYITRVNAGNSRMVSVWEGGNLKFPNGLIRNNTAVNSYSGEYGVLQKALASSQSVQAANSSHVTACVLPANFGTLRGFVCNVSGNYFVRYKTTVQCVAGSGLQFNLLFSELVYNSGTGKYDDWNEITGSSNQTIYNGQTLNIDWDDRINIALTAGKYYAFHFTQNVTTYLTESDASVSLIYRG